MSVQERSSSRSITTATQLPWFSQSIVDDFAVIATVPNEPKEVTDLDLEQAFRSATDALRSNRATELQALPGTFSGGQLSTMTGIDAQTYRFGGDQIVSYTSAGSMYEGPDPLVDFLPTSRKEYERFVVTRTAKRCEIRRYL